jgi:hypothetical protein
MYGFFYLGKIRTVSLYIELKEPGISSVTQYVQVLLQLYNDKSNLLAHYTVQGRVTYYRGKSISKILRALFALKETNK